MRIGGILIAAGLAVFAAPALASAALPIDGIFGTGEGCALFMTGEKQAGTVLLTPDTFTVDIGACYFEELLEDDGTEFLVKVSCAWTDGRSNENELTVIRQGDNLVAGFRRGDVFWEPLSRCPGTEGLLRRGVQV